jgi:hypothetical protein
MFKRKDKYAIPPVEDSRSELLSTKSSSSSKNNSTSPAPAYRKSNASTFVPSRDGHLYSDNFDRRMPETAPDTDPYTYKDKYSRNNGVGDVYSRGGAKLDEDRNELFAGYNPNNTGGSSRFFDGPALHEPKEGEENEEDIEGIKQQTRFVKQESVNSTRNALRMAREAEETARATLGRLGDQSGICLRL